MKKKSIIAIVLTFFILVFTMMPMGTLQFKVDASQAYQKVDSVSAAITAEGVNMRTGPGKTFTSICKLKKGQKVTVMGKLGDWYAVYVGTNGNVGAISAQYLKVEKAKAAAVNTKQASTSKVTEKTVSSTVTKAATVKVSNISKDEQALLDLVNKERKKEGLKVLEFDEGLVKIARLKAADMKENNYFSHNSSYYGTPFDMMKKYGVKFSIAGENIAGNQSTEKAVKAWLNESGNNIFNGKFTHTGIGIVDSPTYGKLFVQMFIKK